MAGIILGESSESMVVDEGEMTDTLRVSAELLFASGGAGFSLSRDRAGLSESGSTDMFSVVLTGVPNSDVVLTVTSGDTSEVAVAPATLTFTLANWNVSQTVTITGVDDFVIDGDQTTRVTVSVDDAASANDFDPLPDQVVMVTTTDDDVAGFTLSKTTVTVSESGTTDTVTVVLTAQPDTDVILTVTSGDISEATAGPMALKFTPSGWDAPQTVTVHGVDDSLRDGNQVTAVTVGVDDIHSDVHFAGVGSQVISATTIDDDAGWHNTKTPSDVDGNGMINAADVLIIVNYLNEDSGAPALPRSLTPSSPYYDVNNDGLCTAIDVLIVINYINIYGVPHASGGEGEDAPRDAAAPDAAFRVSTDEPPQGVAANATMASTFPVDSSTAQDLPSEAVTGYGIDESRDFSQPADTARPALLPAADIAQRPGDTFASAVQARPAQPACPRRFRRADAVFEAWREEPWDGLADGLLRTLDRVSS